MVVKVTSGNASDAINKSVVLHVNTADAKTDVGELQPYRYYWSPVDIKIRDM